MRVKEARESLQSRPIRSYSFDHHIPSEDGVQREHR